MKKTLVFNFFVFLIFIVNAQNKVAIVGAGMSGVSAAHHILEVNPNAEITLFEKEATVGGNARTIQIDNKGKKVYVDAGPQYFVEGPWDEYIKFLKAYNLYNENEISPFIGSIVVSNDLDKKPDFVTPKNGSFRGEKFTNLLMFNKFYSAARKVYLQKVDFEPAIGDWLNSLSIKEPFKEDVLLPFLASSLGTSVQEIKLTATAEIISLFAIRPATQKSVFKIFDKGMGTLIQAVCKELKSKNVNVLRSSPVYSLEKIDSKYRLIYGDNNEAVFDFVVFATHPYQAAKILETESNFSEIKTVLNKFEYFKANIVLHRDSSFVCNEKPSFLNVITSKVTNDVKSNTMNLGIINLDLKGIYKSWFNEKDTKIVKDKKLFIHQELFYHPMITPAFKKYLVELKKLSKKVNNIYFAGGWSEGLETQETAVNSGKNAAKEYEKYLNK